MSIEKNNIKVDVNNEKKAEKETKDAKLTSRAHDNKLLFYLTILIAVLILLIPPYFLFINTYDADSYINSSRLLWDIAGAKDIEKFNIAKELPGVAFNCYSVPSTSATLLNLSPDVAFIDVAFIGDDLFCSIKPRPFPIPIKPDPDTSISYDVTYNLSFLDSERNLIVNKTKSASIDKLIREENEIINITKTGAAYLVFRYTPTAFVKNNSPQHPSVQNITSELNFSIDIFLEITTPQLKDENIIYIYDVLTYENKLKEIEKKHNELVFNLKLALVIALISIAPGWVSLVPALRDLWRNNRG